MNKGMKKGRHGIHLGDFIQLYWSRVIIQKSGGDKMERCFRSRLWATCKTRIRGSDLMLQA